MGKQSFLATGSALNYLHSVYKDGHHEGQVLSKRKAWAGWALRVTSG